MHSCTCEKYLGSSCILSLTQLCRDAENPQYVYDWRLQQETALRAAKGTGMTDQEVVEFVHGYYPSYELYLDDLRSGIYKNEKGKHLHIILGKDRKVIQSVVI